MPDHRAREFIERFVRADAAGEPIAAIADDHEGFSIAIRDSLPELGAAIEEAASHSAGTSSLVDAHAFASAVCLRSGRVVAADSRFTALFGTAIDLADAVADYRTAPAIGRVFRDRSGRTIALAIGNLAQAARWPMEAATRQAAGALGGDALIVVAFRPNERSWSRAARALGLTAAEARIVSALSETGHLKSAAHREGVAYETARKLIAFAMGKTRSRRQADLLALISRVAMGESATVEAAELLLADTYSLSVRQAKLGRLAASGFARSQIAAVAKISEAVVKQELKLVFAACDVAGVADLARTVAEVEALAGLVMGCDISVLSEADHAEPLRLVTRGWAAGRIAVSDFGPPDGVPVIIFHTTTCGRAISPRLLAAMRDAGLRAITFDRSGFGLTDVAGGNPIDVAARDVEAICTALDLPRCLLLARGGTHAALATMSRLHDLVDGAVLLNPGFDTANDADSSSLAIVGRQLLLRHGWIVEPVARLLSKRATNESLDKLCHQMLAGSPGDQLVLADPEEMRAMVRSLRQSSIGVTGFIREIGQLNSFSRTKLPRPDRVLILIGEEEPMFDAARTRQFWTRVHPDVAQQSFPGAGRMLHVTCAREIAAALAALAALGRRSAKGGT